MKRFVLALAIAIGAAVSVPAGPASAASVTIGPNGITVREGRHHDYRRGEYRRDRRHHRRDGWRHHHRRSAYRDHCRVRTVKVYQHHRVVFRKIRVCG